MKLHTFMMAGAMGYALGCKTGRMRRCAMRAAKQFRRNMLKKLGL